jgi:hypothetical protein
VFPLPEISLLLKMRVGVPFFAYYHFYFFRRWEAERTEHKNKANRKAQLVDPLFLLES